MAAPRVTEGIRRVRAGALTVKPGYDGVYGVVKVFETGEEISVIYYQRKLFSNIGLNR